MKYLLTLRSTVLCASLLTSLLLAGCAGDNAPATAEDTSAQPTEIDSSNIDNTDSEAAKDANAEDSEEPANDDADSEDEALSDTEGVEQTNVKLTIDDQKTAGQITVKTVATSRDGWISIHKSREDGSIVVPDSIGEARVDSGDSEDIVVDLWEAPAVGDKLWVLLHIDGGERGTYEYPGADVPVKKNGETMARSFVIEGEKEKEKEEKESDQ